MRGGFLMNSVYCPACWPTYLRLNDSAMPPPLNISIKVILLSFSSSLVLVSIVFSQGVQNLALKRSWDPFVIIWLLLQILQILNAHVLQITAWSYVTCMLYPWPMLWRILICKTWCCICFIDGILLLRTNLQCFIKHFTGLDNCWVSTKFATEIYTGLTGPVHFLLTTVLIHRHFHTFWVLKWTLKWKEEKWNLFLENIVPKSLLIYLVNVFFHSKYLDTS